MGISQETLQRQFAALAADLELRGIDINEIKAQLKTQAIETPSWGYGNSGTRFGVFKQDGAARDVHERLADAAQVHKVTGVCPTVALHIPWDKVDDFAALKQEAADLGVGIGAINPNVFQAADYKLGSFGHRDPAVRQKALDHMYECIDVMHQTDSKLLSLWFADGTNYAGQADITSRKRWFEECLKGTHDALPEDSRMLIEYKFFEPAFYHTDIADWGMALTFANKCGSKAEVLVDLGHHPMGTNIEHIVAFLIDEGKLGGFHFNNRKYADDDLTIGSVNLYEVFLIYNEIVGAEVRGAETNIAYMIDQSHIIKPKIEAMIQSIMNIQMLYAKALLVDVEALEDARSRNDAVDAERVLQAAYQTDVRPLLEKIRKSASVPIDPIQGHRESSYLDNATTERSGAIEGGSSWG